MAKEKKIFGTDIEEAKPKKEEEQIEGMHEINATSGEDLIAQLTAEAAQKSKTRKKKKISEYKAVRATREALFNRLGKTIDVPIIMDNEEVMVFTVKRLSEAENSEIIDRQLAIKDIRDMTADELEESNNYNYRLLEKVVVEPKLSQQEWRLNVDTALVQKVVEQVMKVLTNIDDSEIFSEFQN